MVTTSVLIAATETNNCEASAEICFRRMVSQELGDNDSLEYHLENVGPKPSITGGKLEGSIVESRLFSPPSCLYLPLGCFRCSCFAHDHSVLRFLRGCLQYWCCP